MWFWCFCPSWFACSNSCIIEKNPLSSDREPFDLPQHSSEWFIELFSIVSVALVGIRTNPSSYESSFHVWLCVSYFVGQTHFTLFIRFHYSYINCDTFMFYFSFFFVFPAEKKICLKCAYFIINYSSEAEINWIWTKYDEYFVCVCVLYAHSVRWEMRLFIGVNKFNKIVIYGWSFNIAQ